MKLVSYNIRFGLGLDQEIDLGRFISPYLSQRVDRDWIDQDAIGSDHKPYWVDLAF